MTIKPYFSTYTDGDVKKDDELDGTEKKQDIMLREIGKETNIKSEVLFGHLPL